MKTLYELRPVIIVRSNTTLRRSRFINSSDAGSRPFQPRALRLHCPNLPHRLLEWRWSVRRAACVGQSRIDPDHRRPARSHLDQTTGRPKGAAYLDLCYRILRRITSAQLNSTLRVP
ncbi:hypothetical protein KC356_g218 [Hortaea werneckii]|nr:hypothetical protein KC356_g218 [Hortaea werneckii]